MPENLTAAERNALLAIKGMSVCLYSLPDAWRRLIPDLRKRGLVETERLQRLLVCVLTDAGRAALAGEGVAQHSIRQAKDELAQLRAENERLVEALRQIAKDAPVVKPEWSDYGKADETESNGYDVAHWHFAEIARAALALAGEESEPAKPPISPVDCKHPRTLFIKSSDGGPPSFREHVSVCRDCGQFHVHASREGVHITTWFDLPTWELVQAASQFARLLDTDESQVRPDIDANVCRVAKETFELAIISLIRRLPPDDPARKRAKEALARYGNGLRGVLRQQAEGREGVQ